MTDKPRFELELTLSRLTSHVKVDPTLIPDNLLDEAWHTMNAVVMDIFDSLGEEPTDEEYRARFIETCFRLIYREMFTLGVMPDWEVQDLERLGTRKRGPRVHKEGFYGNKSEW